MLREASCNWLSARCPTVVAEGCKCVPVGANRCQGRLKAGQPPRKGGVWEMSDAGTHVGVGSRAGSRRGTRLVGQWFN